MPFDSLSFLCFFVLVISLHHLIFSWTLKKANLLFFSYLFYAAWHPPYILILLASTFVDWIAAGKLAAAQTIRTRKCYLVASIIANLGLLAFFKYGAFIADNFSGLFQMVGLHITASRFDFLLPIGISFFTFQTLSYTFDVYRKEIVHCRSFLNYALFVSFFPQLLAGPIVRAGEFIPQCREKQECTTSMIGWGLSLMAIGLFQKSVLADGLLTPIADRLFALESRPGFVEGWLGVFAFSGQIYFDFSGYSVCAVGIALCLGFRIPDNFHYPYAAVGFSDFWRRWHISLSRWFRDYIYIPLGGSRSGLLRAAQNILLTMLLGGLWHGAEWKFVLWGLVHGLYLILESGLKLIFTTDRLRQSNSVQLGLAVITFILVSVTWVLFRAPSSGQARAMLLGMIGLAENVSTVTLSKVDVLTVLSLTIGLFGYHWIMRDKHLVTVVEKIPWWGISLLIAFTILCIVIVSADSNEFIYFKF